jgi:hypothetical protein
MNDTDEKDSNFGDKDVESSEEEDDEEDHLDDDWVDAESDEEDNSKSKWPVKIIESALTSLQNHMDSSVAGEVDPSRQQSIMKRVTHLLCWTAGSKDRDLKNSMDVFKWFAKLITTYFALLPLWIKNLERTEVLAPTTILNWINDVVFAMKWFTYFSEDGRSQKLNPMSLQPVLTVVAAMRKGLNKSIKNLKSKQTVESEVKRRRMPSGEGGLQILQSIVAKNVTWALTIGGDVLLNDEFSFRRFMKLLFASIYTSGGQGRISGVQSLVYKNISDIIKQKFAVTKVFKTGFKYGYQVYLYISKQF